MRTLARRCVLFFLAVAAVAPVACDTTSEPERAETIEISPAVVQMSSVGSTRQLEVLVTGRSGDELEGAEVAWTSTVPSVAIVSESGVITSVGNGTARI